MKGNEHNVFKTNQHAMLESGIALELVRTYPTWRMRIKVFLQKSSQAHQRPEPKMFGKKRENGVGTSLALSMRPYAHITLNHAKKGHLIKTCYFTLKILLHIQEPIHVNHTYLLSQ